MTINSVYGLRATCIHNKVPYPIGKCSNKCVCHVDVLMWYPHWKWSVNIHVDASVQISRDPKLVLWSPH